MRENPSELLLISPLADMEDDASWARGEQLPLHVTVMPWFGGLSISALKNALINHCTDYDPFEITAGDDETFGTPEDPVKVNKLQRVGQLSKLHHDILDLISSMGGHVESDWIGDRYAPHVSYLGNIGLRAGEVRTLDRLDLVGKYADGHKHVESVFPFSAWTRRS